MPDAAQRQAQAAADGLAVQPPHSAPALTAQQIRGILHDHRGNDPAIRNLHDTGAITADTAPALGILHDRLDGQPDGDLVHDVLEYVLAVGIRPPVTRWNAGHWQG